MNTVIGLFIVCFLLFIITVSTLYRVYQNGFDYYYDRHLSEDFQRTSMFWYVLGLWLNALLLFGCCVFCFFKIIETKIIL
jgi:uncharacterized BrkB/YihY/UPF0761 family membrane protein